MAQSLIYIITLVVLVAASPLGKRQTGCSQTWWSQAGNTCDSIGAMFGLTGEAIKQYNEHVDCNNIRVNTPICIGPLPTFRKDTQPASSCYQYWWSRPGDTCDSIGAMYGLPGPAIAKVNPSLDCNHIPNNTKVCIPSPPTRAFFFADSPTSSASDPATTSFASCVETWWSEAGDTCQSIGAIFGLTEQAIIDANGFLDCSDIGANTPVCIPYVVDHFISLISTVSEPSDTVITSDAFPTD